MSYHQEVRRYSFEIINNVRNVKEKKNEWVRKRVSVADNDTAYERRTLSSCCTYVFQLARFAALSNAREIEIQIATSYSTDSRIFARVKVNFNVTSLFVTCNHPIVVIVTTYPHMNSFCNAKYTEEKVISTKKKNAQRIPLSDTDACLNEPSHWLAAISD